MSVHDSSELVSYRFTITVVGQEEEIPKAQELARGLADTLTTMGLQVGFEGTVGVRVIETPVEPEPIRAMLNRVRRTKKEMELARKGGL